MDLSRKVFGENVDPKIIEYFEKLQESNFDLQPGDPVGVSYDKQTYYVTLSYRRFIVS